MKDRSKMAHKGTPSDRFEKRGNLLCSIARTLAILGSDTTTTTAAWPLATLAGRWRWRTRLSNFTSLERCARTCGRLLHHAYGRKRTYLVLTADELIGTLVMFNGHDGGIFFASEWQRNFVYK